MRAARIYFTRALNEMCKRRDTVIIRRLSTIVPVSICVSVSSESRCVLKLSSGKERGAFAVLSRLGACKSATYSSPGSSWSKMLRPITLAIGSLNEA